MIYTCSVLVTLFVEPEYVGLAAVAPLFRKKSVVCVPDIESGQVEVALKYGIDVASRMPEFLQSARKTSSFSSSSETKAGSTHFFPSTIWDGVGR